MKMPVLDLEFDADPKTVKENRQTIDVEIKKCQAMIDGLKGLHVVNQSMCKHADKKDVYDPGYAGGEHDGYRCDDCGKRGYF